MTLWYESGQKETEGNYIEGKKDGKWTDWHENGQKKNERYYKDDVCISCVIKDS